MSDKRQHIVDTAYVLFRERGFHATGIDLIIAEAGVAKMTMYRHFPNKDGLIVAVLRDRAARFEARLDALPAATPAGQIATILDWHARWFASPGFHGCLFAHALAEYADPVHPVFQAALAQKDGFRQRLRRILAPVLSTERAAEAALAIVMLIEGATLMAQAGQGEAAMAAARQAAAAIVAGRL